MKICRALLKYGYSNFSLTILEYCEPSKCLEREGYYFKLLNTEYNIAKEPGAPFSGRTHSEETKQKISDANKGTTLSDETKQKMSDTKKGENNSMFGKNHSDESKKIMSDAKKGENNPRFGKPRPAGSGKSSQQIEVTDIKNNTTTTYNSMCEATRALNINQASIFMYFKNNQQKPYKAKYTFKKL
jgi:group I intron endonuclease